MTMSAKRLVFFSGGTAFNITSSMLAQYTKDVTYIVTTFDSGGSTGILRSLIPMPAIGDIRKRMLALADPECSQAIFDLFSFRASRNPTFEEIDTIYTLLYREHPIWKEVESEVAQKLALYIDTFTKRIEQPFSFSELSLGNCIFVGAMLYHTSLYQAIQELSEILCIHGSVLPITEEDVHIVGIGYDGREYVGQKIITTEAQVPFDDFFLAMLTPNAKKSYTPIQVKAPKYVVEALSHADAICYPMGSFYSSILACLLVTGVSETISQAVCPKIYIPNVGIDREQGGMSVAMCVDTLLKVVGTQREHAIDYITHIILDTDSSVYVNGIEEENIPDGIELVYISNLATTVGTAPEKIVEFFSSL
ncbi:MAG: 2-phospho-L-lactate transferase CofD family protein [Desulfovibrionaceae bacterium]|nr:2-phospho-L-lactate transferase CofD family protein [Desulfovibrionaceae bacterium]